MKNPVETEALDPELGAAGFRRGSVSELTAAALIAGGKISTTKIMQDLRSEFPDRSNNWSVTMSTVISKMTERGFELEGEVHMRVPGSDELVQPE